MNKGGDDMLPFVRMFDYGNEAPAPAPIKKVVTAGNSTVVILSSGKMYVRGSNTLGLFGLGDTTTRTQWTESTNEVDDAWAFSSTILIKKFSGNYYYSGSPSNIGFDGVNTAVWVDCTSHFDTLESSVKEIVNSDSTISVLLDNNTIWSAGGGSAGQLGNTTTPSTQLGFVLAAIDYSTITPVKLFASSTMHSFIDTDNKLYYTGTVPGISTAAASTMYTKYTKDSLTNSSYGVLYYQTTSKNQAYALAKNSIGDVVVYTGGNQNYGACANGITNNSLKTLTALSAARQPPGTIYSLYKGNTNYAVFAVSSEGIYASGYNSGSFSSGVLGINNNTNASTFTAMILPTSDIQLEKVKIITTEYRTYVTDGYNLYSTGGALTTYGGPTSLVLVLDDPRFS